MACILAQLNNLVELSTIGTRGSYHHTQVYLSRDKLNPANSSSTGYAIVRISSDYNISKNIDCVDNSSHVVSNFGNKSINIANLPKFSWIEWSMMKYILEISQFYIILVIAHRYLNQTIPKKFLQNKLHRWTLVPADSLNEGNDFTTDLAEVKVSRQTKLEEEKIVQ